MFGRRGTATRMSECDVMAPMVQLERDANRLVFPELLVTINGETSPPDLISQSTINPRDIAWFEGKLSLTWELVEQCKVGLPHANYVAAVVAEPKSKSSMHNTRRKTLESLGIGLWYVSAGGRATLQIRAKHRMNVDTSPVLEAIQRNARSEPPRSGSFAVRRKKSQYENVIALLREEGGCADIRQIRRAMRWTQTQTTVFKKSIRDGIERDFELLDGTPPVIGLVDNQANNRHGADSQG